MAAFLAMAALACAPAPSTPEAERSGTTPRPDPVSPDPPPLRVGTSGDYTPFSHWPNAEPEPAGFSVDVARAFAASQGRRIHWVRFAWPALAADLEAGRFDVALSGVTIRPDRSLEGRFSLPLTTTGAVALVAPGSSARTRAELDRPGVRIAVNHGGHLERVARTLFPRAVVEALPDNAAVPRQLAAGRAEAVLTDDLEAPHWQARLPGSRAIGPLTRDRKAAWFPKGGEALARDFDAWLLRFEAGPGLAALRARHGLAPTRSASPLPALLARLDERLSLMPEVARAKAVLARPVTDAAQEERVHAAFRAAAAQAAAHFATPPPSDTVLRRFVDAQLAAARFVQTRALSARRTEPLPGEAERAAAREALDERVRPALAFITERIAWLLVAVRAESGAGEAGGAGARVDPVPEGETARAALARALESHALPAAIEAELQAALEAVLEAPVTPAPSARRAAPARRARPERRDTGPSA